MRVGRSKATVTGGYDPKTGKIVSGSNSNPVGCAEDDVVRKLGVATEPQSSLKPFVHGLN